jgi:hypothetical protein
MIAAKRPRAEAATSCRGCDRPRAGAEPGRIESILHDGDRRHAKFMADADLVIHDAQYPPEEYGAKKTWGHSTYDYVVQIAAAAGVRRVALTHHDPSHDDHFVANISAESGRPDWLLAWAPQSSCNGTICLQISSTNSLNTPFPWGSRTTQLS